MTESRREFLAHVGAAAAAAVIPLGCVHRPVGAATRAAEGGVAVRGRNDIHFGYAAITWGGDDIQAIGDIASLGYAGIQLRANVLTQFGDRPAELRAILARHRLAMVALSSGLVTLDPARERETIDEHVRHARFTREIGGLYLQVIDERPAGRAAVPDDYTRLGRLLTAIGERTADLGIPLGYHPHMGSLGEQPRDSDAILAAADPRYVKLELDVAHYQQGGGDPAEAIRRYRDRLLFLHIKDLAGRSPNGPVDSARPYEFVELGRGTVDLRSVFAVLRDVGFRGWAVVELDSVPDRARTPKESALISKRYLESLGFGVGS